MSATVSPEVLHVELVQPQPHLPLILADTAFLTTLRQVEEQVASLRITDDQSNQQAADLLVRLTSAGTAINKQRLALIRPYLDQQDKINAAAKQPTARIENLKQALKVAQTNFEREQERKRVEAERARQAELRRLEEIARLEREAKERELAEIARQAEEARVAQEAENAVAGEPARDPMDFEEEELPPVVVPEKTETEKQIDAIRCAPVPVAVKPAGVRFVTTLVPVVVDVNLLPDMFIEKTPKLAAIRSTFCMGWTPDRPLPVCSGVRFEKKEESQSTGKARF